MVDNLTKSQRSYIMFRIRSTKTKPELKLKQALKALGFIYQSKGKREMTSLTRAVHGYLLSQLPLISDELKAKA